MKEDSRAAVAAVSKLPFGIKQERRELLQCSGLGRSLKLHHWILPKVA